MFKSNRLPILILTLIVVGFYSWTIAFQENEWLLSFGINVLQIIVGSLSLIWLSQAYRSAKPKKTPFWLLLIIGMGLYLSSNWFWLYLQISQGAILSEDISYMIWLLAYLFFLAALIVKIVEMSASFSRNSYIFNSVVFMITATAISFHFLINPVLALSESSWLVTITTIIYPIVNLTIWFTIVILFYLIQNNKENEYMLFCVTGFFCQVTADLIFAYSSYQEAYQPGHFADLLWLLALFFIGITGLYAKDSKREVKIKVLNLYGTIDIIIPYTSILLLLLLVLLSYQWDFNALNIGLLLTFLIVLGRQFQILHKNKKLMNQFKHLAYHDPLTGLNNRRSFLEEIETLLKNHQESQVALLLIDLDRFKVMNDTLGHHIGDEILVKTSERLTESLPVDGLIFRIGGDEFVIVLSHKTDTMLTALAEKILTTFQQSLILGDREINLTLSIGISTFPTHGLTSDDLLKNADAAMYLSKEKGKNTFSFYNTELNSVMVRKLQIETELRKAIQNKQLSLAYQPKVDLKTRKIVGMEALLRWKHPELEWISPAEFIPIAEETGQIISIGEWVLHQACQQNKRWQEQGYPFLCVSVNVSVLQFQHGKFLETVRKAIQNSKLDPQFLELEITESIMQNIRESKEILESLKRMGIKTSIDDFGTGYSSLSVLSKLPIDTIKIDKAFVDELEKTGHYSMIKTIIDLSLNLNLNVVAEGIETEGQMKILKESGCTTGQGYLFSKPVAAEAFEKILQKIDFTKF